MGKKVIVAVINDLSTDVRVHKHCMLLHELGFEVTLVGRILPNSLALNRPYPTHRFKLPVNKGAAFYALYNLYLFIYLLKNPFSFLVSNDLDTLGACFLAARIKGKKIVYDTHEFFTGVPEIQHKPIVKWVWTTIEKLIFPQLKYIITVNNSIAKLYKDLYNKDLMVMRNVTSLAQLPVKTRNRSELGLPENQFIVILQGSGININRGSEELVEAIKHLPNTFLVVVGSGDVWPVLEAKCQDPDLKNKVKLINRLPYAEMMQYTLHADLGCTLDKPGNINYDNSLPNKIFDYLHAGLPVLATHLKEVANVVNSFNVGTVIPECTPAEIEKGIKKLSEDRKYYDTCKTNAILAAQELNWEKEQLKLKDLYKTF